MAKASRPKRKYELDAGVGVNWETNAYGWGLEQMPYMAVLHHPIHGMALYGPFVSEDAAIAWIHKEGDATAFQYYGRVSRTCWLTAAIHVPTHPKGGE